MAVTQEEFIKEELSKYEARPDLYSIQRTSSNIIVTTKARTGLKGKDQPRTQDMTVLNIAFSNGQISSVQEYDLRARTLSGGTTMDVPFLTKSQEFDQGQITRETRRTMIDQNRSRRIDIDYRTGTQTSQERRSDQYAINRARTEKQKLEAEKAADYNKRINETVEKLEQRRPIEEQKEMERAAALRERELRRQGIQAAVVVVPESSYRTLELHNKNKPYVEQETSPGRVAIVIPRSVRPGQETQRQELGFKAVNKKEIMSGVEIARETYKTGVEPVFGMKVGFTPREQAMNQSWGERFTATMKKVEQKKIISEQPFFNVARIPIQGKDGKTYQRTVVTAANIPRFKAEAGYRAGMFSEWVDYRHTFMKKNTFYGVLASLPEWKPGPVPENKLAYYSYYTNKEGLRGAYEQVRISLKDPKLIARNIVVGFGLGAFSGIPKVGGFLMKPFVKGALIGAYIGEKEYRIIKAKQAGTLTPYASGRIVGEVPFEMATYGLGALPGSKLSKYLFTQKAYNTIENIKFIETRKGDRPLERIISGEGTLRTEMRSPMDILTGKKSVVESNVKITKGMGFDFETKDSFMQIDKLQFKTTPKTIYSFRFGRVVKTQQLPKIQPIYSEVTARTDLMGFNKGFDSFLKTQNVKIYSDEVIESVLKGRGTLGPTVRMTSVEYGIKPEGKLSPFLNKLSIKSNSKNIPSLYFRAKVVQPLYNLLNQPIKQLKTNLFGLKLSAKYYGYQSSLFSKQIMNVLERPVAVIRTGPLKTDLLDMKLSAQYYGRQSSLFSKQIMNKLIPRSGSGLSTFRIGLEARRLSELPYAYASTYARKAMQPVYSFMQPRISAGRYFMLRSGLEARRISELPSAYASIYARKAMQPFTFRSGSGLSTFRIGLEARRLSELPYAYASTYARKAMQPVYSFMQPRISAARFGMFKAGLETKYYGYQSSLFSKQIMNVLERPVAVIRTGPLKTDLLDMKLSAQYYGSKAMKFTENLLPFKFQFERIPREATLNRLDQGYFKGEFKGIVKEATVPRSMRVSPDIIENERTWESLFFKQYGSTISPKGFMRMAKQGVVAKDIFYEPSSVMKPTPPKRPYKLPIIGYSDQWQFLGKAEMTPEAVMPKEMLPPKSFDLAGLRLSFEKTRTSIPKTTSMGTSKTMSDFIASRFQPQSVPALDTVFESFAVPKVQPDQNIFSLPKVMPMQIPTQIPAQIPKQVPAQIPKQVPAQIPKQVPMQIPTQIPQQIPKQVPAQIPKQVPMQIPTQIPQQIPAQIPKMVPVEIPVPVPRTPPPNFGLPFALPKFPGTSKRFTLPKPKQPKKYTPSVHAVTGFGFSRSKAFVSAKPIPKPGSLFSGVEERLIPKEFFNFKFT